LFPLDGMLNLPDLDVSYNLQKNLVLEVIKTSFDESIESIKRWTGVSITKEQAKKIIIESANDFNKFYDFQFLNEKKEAKTQPLVILTSDGKGVVMRTEALREATRKKAESSKTNNRSRHFLNKIKFKTNGYSSISL